MILFKSKEPHYTKTWILPVYIHPHVVFAYITITLSQLFNSPSAWQPLEINQDFHPSERQPQKTNPCSRSELPCQGRHEKLILTEFWHFCTPYVRNRGRSRSREGGREGEDEADMRPSLKERQSGYMKRMYSSATLSGIKEICHQRAMKMSAHAVSRIDSDLRVLCLGGI